MCEIKFTIKVIFGDGCVKPNLDEMVNFAKALDGDPAQIEAVYKVSEVKVLFIKYKHQEAMRHALEFNAEDLVFHYENGKATNVRVSHAGEYIQCMRVYDLPLEISDQDITTVLSKYGKDKRVIREQFPSELCFDAYTGVRGVYIDVKQEIPTSLYFINRKGYVYYPGNMNRCFVCKKEGHRMDTCPQRKPRKQQQDGDQCEGNTYAGVVSGDTSLTNEKQEMDIQHEEVQEEDMTISNEEINDDENESSIKNNAFYKIALKSKEKQDEEKERKRLIESKEQRDKAKARKKHHK